MDFRETKEVSVCPICGREIPIYHAVLGAFFGGKMYSICLSHEGSFELDVWIASMKADCDESMVLCFG